MAHSIIVWARSPVALARDTGVIAPSLRGPVTTGARQAGGAAIARPLPSLDRADHDAPAVGDELGHPLLASPLDEDRAARVFHNLARDTPMEQPREPGLAPRSEHDEIGRPRRRPGSWPRQRAHGHACRSAPRQGGLPVPAALLRQHDLFLAGADHVDDHLGYALGRVRRYRPGIAADARTRAQRVVKLRGGHGRVHQ